MKMTIKEIKYGGFTETPSDYECPDGDLATVSGLVPEDDALRPVQIPKRLFTLPPNGPNNYWTVAYIHQNTGYKHYIVRHHTSTQDLFYWMDQPPVGTVFVDSPNPGEGETTFDTTKLLQAFNDGATPTAHPIQICQVNATGNALMILTEKGMYYFLWKGTSYTVLGNHLPEIKLSFGLQGAADKTQEPFTFYSDGNLYQDESTAYGDTLPPDATDIDTFVSYEIITEPFKKELTDAIMAKVNAFVAKSAENGKFLFPFLVRYAYRLHDESLVMQSCPVLMITDTYCSPHVFYYRCYSAQDDTGEACLGAMLYDLDYEADLPNNLNDWKDIIKSVEIFVSEPIYTYDQSGKIKGWDKKINTGRGFGVFNIPSNNSTFVSPVKTGSYSRYYTTKLIWDPDNYPDWPTQVLPSPELEFTLPRFSDSEMEQKIRDVHNFYLLKSVPVDKLSTSRTVIEVPRGFLADPSSRELMSDDFQSHDLLIPKYSFTYNSRNIVANISRKLLNPFTAKNVFCYSYNSQSTYNVDADPLNATYDIYVFINENNKEYVIHGDMSVLGGQNPFYYLFYPNPNAYKAVVHKYYSSGGTTYDQYYELLLTKHDFLNGAVYFAGWSPVPSQVSAPAATTNNIVEMPNKIFVSVVDNPFVFTSKGVRTVGIGAILGIRPAIKAVSPSQYGQYDLYGFTTDGIYVMKVTSEGYLDPPSPVTPDIVNGAGESITQIDGTIVFATERGIMMTSGSTTICISDILNSKQPFVPFGTTADKDVLPCLRNIVPSDIMASVHPVLFQDFVKDCRMIYDYPHQRVLVFNPARPYAYVYSLKSKQWGMIPSAMQQPVIDYPSATVMVEFVEDTTVGGVTNTVHRWALCDFADETAPSLDPEHPVDTVYQGLVITRPLKFDMSDVLKTVPTVIQRGVFERGNVSGALYGSRDLINWHLVWSSGDHYIRGQHGTPYKYFRLALICNLADKESLYGCSAGVLPRDTNNLR